MLHSQVYAFTHIKKWHLVHLLKVRQQRFCCYHFVSVESERPDCCSLKGQMCVCVCSQSKSRARVKTCPHVSQLLEFFFSKAHAKYQFEESHCNDLHSSVGGGTPKQGCYQCILLELGSLISQALNWLRH